MPSNSPAEATRGRQSAARCARVHLYHHTRKHAKNAPKRPVFFPESRFDGRRRADGRDAIQNGRTGKRRERTGGAESAFDHAGGQICHHTRRTRHRAAERAFYGPMKQG